MERANSSPGSKTSSTSQRALSRWGIALVVLLVLYYYLVPVILSLWGLRDTTARYFMALGTYSLCIGSIVCYGTDRLETLRDHFSLWIIVASCLLNGILPSEDRLIQGLFVVLATTLAIYIIVNRMKIRTPSLRLVFMGLLWSTVAVLVIATIFAMTVLKSAESLPTLSLSLLRKGLLTNLLLISVPEEAVFRGLIYSFLLLAGLSDGKALFVQAALFWGMHFLDVYDPILFFLIIPLGTVFMTLTIRKSRMMFSSVIVHTVVNVLGIYVGVLIARLAF